MNDYIFDDEHDQTVQSIIEKLKVSHIELRSDESIDIQQYNHTRKVDLHVLKLEDDMLKIKNAFLNVRCVLNVLFVHNSDSVVFCFCFKWSYTMFFLFCKVMRSPMKRLEMNRISTAKEPAYLTKYFILERREFFRRNPPEGLDVSRL